MEKLKAVLEVGQSIWLDYIRRDLITSGDLGRLVDEGLRGLTSNPTIFDHAIAETDIYDSAIRAILRANPDTSTKTLYELLTVEDVQMAADTLRPVYDSSGGYDGYVSLEVSPHLAYDNLGTIREVRNLWQLVERPNVMIKVPATEQGFDAIEPLTAEGINVNATLMFSLKHYEGVSKAYIRGCGRSQYPERTASVASFFVSRVDTYVDRELERINSQEALSLRGKAGVANSKLVYRRFREVFFGDEFADLRQRGARVQRVLWGSTSTKNPAYSDIKYVEELMGPDTVNTIPPKTLDAFRDHGKVQSSLQEGMEEAQRVMADLARIGISMDSITEQLQTDGVKAFADSYDQLLGSLQKKREALLAKSL